MACDVTGDTEIIPVSARKGLYWLAPGTFFAAAAGCWLYHCWSCGHDGLRGFMIVLLIAASLWTLQVLGTVVGRRRLVIGPESVQVLQGKARVLAHVPYDNLCSVYGYDDCGCPVLYLYRSDPFRADTFGKLWPFRFLSYWERCRRREMVVITAPFMLAAEPIIAKIAARAGAYQGIAWQKDTGEPDPAPDRAPTAANDSESLAPGDRPAKQSAKEAAHS